MLPLSSLDSVVVKHVIKMEKSIAFVIGFQNEGGDDDDDVGKIMRRIASHTTPVDGIVPKIT